MNNVILIGQLGSDAERLKQPSRWPRSAPGWTAKPANAHHKPPGSASSLCGIEPLLESVLFLKPVRRIPDRGRP